MYDVHLSKMISIDMMKITVTLPDGAQKTFAQGTTVMQVAESIGSGLAKATLAGKLDGNRLVDASYPLMADVSLSLITAKDGEGLEIIRHSTAHLLAQAVKRLFPKVQVTIGPVIENGFYYDFSYPEGFTPEDLAGIEAEMLKIVKEALPVTRAEYTRDAAIAFFEERGERYKAEIIRDIPAQETLTLYSQGEFTDLCRGPHVPNTSHLKVFKLMRVSGAYWRGDSKNEMLQRIYGTAWTDKKDLKAYIERLAEAEKRDHRKIAKQLNLFHFQEDAPGIAFWHADGVKIWRVVEDYMRQSNQKYGCDEIKTPLIADVSLWERSGHRSKYSSNMFTTEVENRDYAIRPMNCPGGLQVYNAGLHSYRDLPIRLAEFGIVHRNEPSGALHGLMRARSFTQDDGHIYCTEAQVEAEVSLMIDQAFEVYSDFGFTNFEVKLALRPNERLGSDEVWDKAETVLAKTLENKGIPFKLLPGEGAFYGPKIEFHLMDSIGRQWQCGTIQVDFSMPVRLGAHYIDEHSQKATPVMLHRAIVGSLERFIGIVIEDCAGWFPFWLAPYQVSVLTITERQDAYAKSVLQTLLSAGYRAQADLRNEKIGFKIREHTLARVPFLVIVGDQEVEKGLVTVRTRAGEDLGQMQLTAFVGQLAAEVSKKSQKQSQ